MKTKVGMKTTISLANGVRFPALVVGDEEVSEKTIVNRVTNALVNILITRVDVISFRKTLEGVPYLKLTNEVVNYGYRPIMEPRFSTIVGLDATEEGEKISLQTLIEKYSAEYGAWQEANFAARNTTVAADDL